MTMMTIDYDSDGKHHQRSIVKTKYKIYVKLCPNWANKKNSATYHSSITDHVPSLVVSI